MDKFITSKKQNLERSTMSQERLSGLAILSMEKEMLVELECKNLISNFASQKARKIYEFIIKYNKRSFLKLSPRALKFVKPALSSQTESRTL